MFLEIEGYGAGAGAVNACNDSARLIQLGFVDPMCGRTLTLTHASVCKLLVHQEIRLTKE